MAGFSGDNIFKSILGGGIPGSQPIGGSYRDSQFGNDRGVNEVY